jgi:hypothetical protein
MIRKCDIMVEIKQVKNLFEDTGIRHDEHSYNASYLGGRDRENCSLRPVQAKS